MVTLRIGVFGGCLPTAVRFLIGMPWRMVIFSGADQDVRDEQPEHALAFGHCGGGGASLELGEESLQVIGGLEVGLAVGELGRSGRRPGRGGWLRVRAGAASGHGARRW
jgi:hypothetical protein